jgi:hypothetical protein
MSAIAVAVIGGVSAIAGGAIAAHGASSAADKQVGAAKDATAEAARQYDLTRQDFAPYREQGAAAAGELASFLGLPTASGGGGVDPNAAKRAELQKTIADLQEKQAQGGPLINVSNRMMLQAAQKQLADLGPAPTAVSTSSPADIMNKLQQTPGYQFNLEQGLQGVSRSAAARTGTLSGGATKAAQTFGAGLASNEFGNAVSRLMNLAQLGAGATANLGAIGQNTSGQIQSNIIGAGNASAAGSVGAGNAWNQAIGGLSGNLTNMMMLRGSGYGSPQPAPAPVTI